MRWIIVFALIALTNCGASRTSSAGGHKYRIPPGNSLSSSPEWLPPIGRDEFLFLLNPRDEPTQQVIVSVIGKKSFCIDPNRTPVVQQLCASHLANVDLSGEPTLVSNSMNVNWVYVDRVRFGSQTARVIVAHCSGSRPGNGLCQSDATVDDVIYTIGFPERLLPHLRKLHQEVREKLTAWRVD